MPPWKCPHCGTPQADSARCWACSRSPITCSTCKAFRRSIAGRLGYCSADKARTVLTGDEVRECWRAASTAPEPFLGLFGSLTPAVAPPARPDSVQAPAPTPAAAAQRRWDEIVAGSGVADPIAARGGSSATARAIPVWPDPPGAGTPALAATEPPSALDAPPDPAPDPARWRHPTIDERSVPPPVPIAAEPVSRRSSTLSLLPATLTNRLRRQVGTRGWRAIPVEGDPPRSLPMPAPSPATSATAVKPAVRGATPIAAARPVAPGRLVEAPSVPAAGTIATLGDQLRRAEQIRRERGLLDGERLRGDRRGDPGA